MLIQPQGHHCYQKDRMSVQQADTGSLATDLSMGLLLLWTKPWVLKDTIVFSAACLATDTFPVYINQATNPAVQTPKPREWSG